MGSGSRRKFIRRRRTISTLRNKRATLLRNVNLFLLVYVAEKIYQTTNKGNCSQAERDPSVRVTAGGIRIGHKSIEIIDCTDGGRHAYQYRENIFQAFHFEPPGQPNEIMKVKEKAAFLANNGCMLTPGMRECKSDIC
jgi:hypothetical protein